MKAARIVFMGSPEFAVPILEALVAEFNIVGVVTQPDRPAGRGNRLTSPAVKNAAARLHLPIIQPQRLRQPEAMEQLRQWEPEVIVVAAFGQILKPEVLALPRYGCLNIHASLLPRWRGAAPVAAAILHGDSQTGVSLMLMDAGVDTGPVLSQKSTPILHGETAGSLTERLSAMGAELLLAALPAYLAGNLLPIPQVEIQATLAPMLKKGDGLLDFNRPAVELVRRVHAFNPWPGAYTFWKGQMLKIHLASSSGEAGLQDLPAPGFRLVWNERPAFATSEGVLLLEEVQPAGRKPVSGKAFLSGARDWAQKIDASS